MMTKKSEAPDSRKNGLAWNVLLLFVLTYLQVFGYVQLAKPFCAHEPHTLPRSYLSDNYPCDGSVLDKVLYLGTQPGRVYSDYLRLQHPDSWVSASAACLLLRLVLALVRPSFTRHKWVTMAHRLVAPITLLAWVLTHEQEPSILAMWFIRSWPLLDCAYVLVFPTTVRLEAGYGITSFIASLLIALNIQSRRPHLVFTLTTCAVSTAWIQYVHVCWAKQTAAAATAGGSAAGRRGRGRAGGQGVGGTVSTAAAAAGGSSDSGGDMEGGGAVRRRHRGAVLAGSGGGLTAAPDSGGDGEAASGTAAAEGTASEGGGSTAAAAASDATARSGAVGEGFGGGVGGAVTVAEEADSGGSPLPACLPAERATGPAGDSAGAPAEDAVSLLPLTPSAASPSAPVSRPGVEVAATAAAAAAWSPYTAPAGAARRQHYRRPPSDDLVLERDDTHAGGAGPGLFAAATMVPPPQMSYTPVVRLVRVQLKINGAEPDQVTPGYEDRISRVVAAAGYELDSVYMRRGCLELVMNLRSWQNTAAGFEAAQEQATAAESPGPSAMTTAGVAEAVVDAATEELAVQALSGPAKATLAVEAASVMTRPRGGGGGSGPGSPADGSRHRHRLPIGNADGGSGGAGAAGKSVVVVDVRATGAVAMAAAVAASRGGNAAVAASTDSSGSSGTRLWQLSTTAEGLAMAPGAAAADHSIPCGAAGADTVAGVGADIDIGAIIQALGLDRSGSGSGSLRSDDDADAGDGAKEAAAAADVGPGPGELSGVEAAAGAATMAARVPSPARSRPSYSAADLWTHPPLPLQPPSLTASAPPPSSPSMAVAAGPAAWPQPAPVWCSPCHHQPARATVAAAAATEEAAATPEAATAAATAAAAAGACWWIGVYPRAICSAAGLRSAAAGPPGGAVYGPFRLEVSVVWPPYSPSSSSSSSSSSFFSAAGAVSGAPAPPSRQQSPPPPPVDQLHLLLRSRGLHLTARVVQVVPVQPPPPPQAPLAGAEAPDNGGGGGGGGGGTCCTALQYSLEVPYLPSRPGLLMMDVEGVAAVPVVLLHDGEVAAGLQLAVDRWTGTTGELDDLLTDVATFAAGLADAEELAAVIGVAAPPSLNARFLSLGWHLLAFSERNDWPALAAFFRRALTTSVPAVAAQAAQAAPLLLAQALHPLPVAAASCDGASCPVVAAEPAVAAGTAATAAAAASATPLGGAGSDRGSGGGRGTGATLRSSDGSSTNSFATTGGFSAGSGDGGGVAAADSLQAVQAAAAAAPSGSPAWPWKARAPRRGCNAEELRSRRMIVSWKAARVWAIQGLEVLAVGAVLWRLLFEWRLRSEALGPTALTAAALLLLLGAVFGLAGAAVWLGVPGEAWTRRVAVRQSGTGLVRLVIEAVALPVAAALGSAARVPLPLLLLQLRRSGWRCWLLVLLVPVLVLAGGCCCSELKLCASADEAAGAAEGVEAAGACDGRRAVLRGCCGFAGLWVAASLACHLCLCHGHRQRQRQWQGQPLQQQGQHTFHCRPKSDPQQQRHHQQRHVKLE